LVYLNTLDLKKYIATKVAPKQMKTLNIDDQTHKRLTSIISDMMHTRKHDINYDDAINELIDVYQDSLRFSGENAGG